MLVKIQKIMSIENGISFVEFFFTQRCIPVASKEPRISEDSVDLIGKWFENNRRLEGGITLSLPLKMN